MIRPAAHADVEAIAAVHTTSWRETYTGLMPAEVIAARSFDDRVDQWRQVLSDFEAFGRAAAFVACDAAGGIVGLGCCGPQRSPVLADQGYAGEILAIYVLASAQRAGHGKGLMRAMADYLAGHGLGAVGLWALRGGPACGFYERLGGRLVGEREDRRDAAVFIDVAYGWPDLAAALS